MDAGLLSNPETLRNSVVSGFEQNGSLGISLDSSEPLVYFQTELHKSRPWAIALLETIGLWKLPYELYDGRIFHYLIDGEAFDWLPLAERILSVVPEAVSSEDRDALLFNGVLPPYISISRFKAALGPMKYRAHLSYFYGVTVEEALIHAVEVETLKSRSVRGLNHYYGVDDIVMERLYGADFKSLLRSYHRHQGRRMRTRHSLSDWKGFIYWLFKYRVNRADASKVASDTKKGIDTLEMIGALTRVYVDISKSPPTTISNVGSMRPVTVE